MKKILLLMILVIMLLPGGARADIHEADYVPWSGHWWPFRNGELVRGYYPRWEPSPLAKYDYVVEGRYEGPAMDYGRDHYYDTEAPYYYGLCMAWATAAMLEPEPVHKGVYENTPFCVGDKKGLITAAYDGVRRLYHGVNTPLGFHQVLEDIIGTQGLPIIIDTGVGEEVWNYPVYKYDSSYTVHGNVRHYSVTIYMADDDVDPDDVGTVVRQRRYYYYFVMDGDTVMETGWERGSETRYPKKSWMPFGTGDIDNGLDYDTVKDIIATDGDAFEGNDTAEEAASIANGCYSLVALGTDWFRTALRAGDRLRVHLMADVDGAAHLDGGFVLRLYDPGLTCIAETAVVELEEGRLMIAADETGDYYCAVEPVKPEREPFYHLSVQRELDFQSYFPTIPAGLWVTGMAVLDADMNDGRIDMTVIDTEGHPRTDYRNDEASFMVGVADTHFGLACPDSAYVRVDSDHTVKGLHVTQSTWDTRLFGSNIIPGERATDRLFLPDCEVTPWKCDPQVAIINVGAESETVTLAAYGQAGDLLGENTIEILPGEKWTTNVSDIDSDTLSFTAMAISGRACLVGCVEYWSGIMTLYRAGELVPLPLERSTRLIAPHVASAVEWSPHGSWRTTIAVMNTGDTESAVTFSALDGSGNEIATAASILQPNEAYKGEVGEIFPGVSAAAIAAMEVTSDGALLCGSLRYSMDDGYVSAAIPLAGPGESMLHLSHLACYDSWHTGIAVMNTGYTQTIVRFSLMDATGATSAEEQRSLLPNQRLVATIRGLFGARYSPAVARYLKVESVSAFPQSLNGLYLMTTGDGMRMNGDIME